MEGKRLEGKPLSLKPLFLTFSPGILSPRNEGRREMNREVFDS
jgi:hypothetical protein